MKKKENRKEAKPLFFLIHTHFLWPKETWNHGKCFVWHDNLSQFSAHLQATCRPRSRCCYDNRGLPQIEFQFFKVQIFWGGPLKRKKLLLFLTLISNLFWFVAFSLLLTISDLLMSEGGKIWRFESFYSGK